MKHDIILKGYGAFMPTTPSKMLCLGTAESYGIEQLNIIPGAGWEGLVIRATFHPASSEPVVVVVGENGGVIDVPPEATAKATAESSPGVIVFSGVADGVQRISANLAYTVIGHAPVDGEDSEPTPSQWEQLAAQYQSKVDKQQSPENAGKVLGIGEDGLVIPVEQTGGGDITDEIKQEIAQEAAGMIDIPKPLLVVTITDEGTASHSSQEIIEFAQTGEVVFMAEGIRATLVGFYGQVCAFIVPATTEAPAVQIAIAGTNISVQDVPNYFPETLPNPKPLNFSGAVSGSYDGSSEFNLNIPAIPTIPDKLPNPNALTFSGAVEGTYDGSEALTVEIPQGGSGGIVFEDSYVSNANNWVTNGYTKTNTSTTNLPSVITGSDRWGVLFFIAENAANRTGTQMLYPIDGTYKGTIWTRSSNKQIFTEWKQLLTADAISNGVKNPNAITFTGSSVGTYDGSKPLTINIPAGLSDDGSLQIPVATETTLGGVKVPAKTGDMTQPVGIGEDGFLFVGAAANPDDWLTVIDETISLSEGVYSITKSLGKTDPVKEFVLRVDLPVTETQVKFTAKINGVSLNHFNGLNSSTSSANYFQMFGNMFAPYFIYYSGNIDRETSSATTANYRPAGFVEQNGLGEFALVNAGNGTFMGDYRIRLRVRY